MSLILFLWRGFLKRPTDQGGVLEQPLHRLSWVVNFTSQSHIFFNPIWLNGWDNMKLNVWAIAIALSPFSNSYHNDLIYFITSHAATTYIFTSWSVPWISEFKMTQSQIIDNGNKLKWHTQSKSDSLFLFHHVIWWRRLISWPYFFILYVGLRYFLLFFSYRFSLYNRLDI